MICFKHVSKQYGDGSTILDKVSLSLDQGQCTCLLGPSGCGKTTLLNLIAGFIRPTSGTVLVAGQPVYKPGPERGVVFQDATLFPWMTVLANVSFGLRQKGAPKSQADAVAREYLELVGMADYVAALPVSLSGGQRQRVAIARVLALEPQVLLMDEPFSALDANSRERLQDELLRICTVRPTTILYVTHHVDEAAFLAERVLVMGPGPDNIRADIRLAQPRPRNRHSDEFTCIKNKLRQELDQLPCCVAPLPYQGASS